MLDARFPLPLDQPFGGAAALAAGLTQNDLARLVSAGYLRHPMTGVYAAAQVPDSLDHRAAVVRLVIPPDGIVTDRTAGWLHGAPMILAPNDHLLVPHVSAFVRREGGRLRNEMTDSGQRMMPASDIVEMAGLRVTTPLRTACDLGRLLHRDHAFAALDMMLRLRAFSRDELIDCVRRFRGYRGVRQLRVFAPLADARSESPGESAVRLRWLDMGSLPRPEPQRPVRGPGWSTYWLDLGVDELWFAVEYDGEEFHSSSEQRESDRIRREWVASHTPWQIEVVTKENVFGRRRDIEGILLEGVAQARRRLGKLAG